MRRVLRAAAIAALAITTAGLPSADAFRNVPAGTRVPALTLGARAERATIQVPTAGRAAVVFFWRPGQPLCDAALADLVALAPSFRTDRVDVVAVAEPGSGRLPDGVPFDVALDHARGAADVLGVVVYPSTAVIAADGTLLAYVPLHNPSYRAVVDAYVRRAAGRITDAELTARLAAHGVGHGHEADAAREAYARGAAAVGERRFADAADAFEQALALSPDGNDARLRLGWVRLETGDARGALTAFDAVLERAPNTAGARVGAGLARLALGQHDAGVRLLEAALVLNPEPVRAHFALGRAYESRGDTARAAEHFRSALLKLLQGRR